MSPLPLRIYQIYFDEESRRNCFDHPAVTPHYNAVLTRYFENQVILDLSPYSERYVGVWSHLAGKKLVYAGNRSLTPDRLVELCEAGGFDVLGFHHYHRAQVIFGHGTRARFDSMFDYLMRKLGLEHSSRTRPREIVMGNHFIARSEIMNDYCELLRRAIEFMEGDRILKSELARRAPYKKDSQIHYGFHPFICERLFSAYLTLKPELRFEFYGTLAGERGAPRRAKRPLAASERA